MKTMKNVRNVKIMKTMKSLNTVKPMKTKIMRTVKCGNREFYENYGDHANLEDNDDLLRQ